MFSRTGIPLSLIGEPVSAIFALDDLPEKWKQYTKLNESYVKAGKFTPERVRQAQRQVILASDGTC